jgi:transposase
MARHWSVRPAAAAHAALPTLVMEGGGASMTRKNAGAKPARRRVIGGVDTHGDTHHAAVVLMSGRRLAGREFPATEAGYGQLRAWLASFGRVHAVGVEGTGSYGAGLARHLHAAGMKVIEVNRPDRAQRRSKGKSDPLDAYAAAEAVQAGRATAAPKLGTGPAGAAQVLHAARAGAVKAHTAAVNQLKAALVTAPAPLRDQLRHLSTPKLITACAQLTAAGPAAEQATRYALAALARRCQQLSAEIAGLNRELKHLLDRACPATLAKRGTGYETTAQLLATAGDNPHRLAREPSFAALLGAPPVPASSGKTKRHRLSRGGDRQANRALHMIVLSRLATCPATRAYAQRRTTEGLTKKEIIRCLKRYVAREIYKALIKDLSNLKDLAQAA